MARYTGPTFKKSRRYGFSVLENGKEFAKGKQRQTAPGQHGARRVKMSDYGLHLHEKQKVRFMYGINEKQFRKTFEKASKIKGVAGINFLQMLETRLDNVVYRMGFATTRRQARQLVNHGHFTLNGKKADIASMQIKIGDEIKLKEKSNKNVQIVDSLATRKIAEWVELDKTTFSGKLTRLPERKELNSEINEALIVEYYSK
ncbi:30S ribosomal protein S4 [Mycoplasma marinum]|uniref:Small ribosomal subunit protein uS4 n=1 Tax=Mycoplasma marinum TaxID=1937190 RepID=A0A4R0XKR4_9MOLU|nr:30S ribosomal protein S4 [Mycoplasma marinum]TCG11233.1 30S ribosomal protein S4 [Mycoplasma marinum]